MALSFEPLRWPQLYYAATFVFAALDGLLGLNLRAAGFGSGGARAVYYAACLGCGVVARLAPRWAAPVTLAESAVNIVALALSVLLPLYTFDPEAPDPALESYPEVVTNFFVSGTAATVAFYQSLGGLRRASRPPL